MTKSKRAALAMGMVLLVGGCKSQRDAWINTATSAPENRSKMEATARDSCNDAAKERMSSASAAQKTTMNHYCDCVATKGLAQFSNADLVELGLKGTASLTPEQQGKMDKAVAMCQAESGL